MRSFVKMTLLLLFLLLLFLPSTVFSYCYTFYYWSDQRLESFQRCTGESCEVTAYGTICYKLDPPGESCELQPDGSYKCYQICGAQGEGVHAIFWKDPSLCSSGEGCNSCLIYSSYYGILSCRAWGCVPRYDGGGDGQGGGGGGGGGQQDDNQSCDVTVNYVSPMAVWPVIPEKQQPYGYSDDWNNSSIMISLNKPAPAEGCTINFSVEAVKDSGEHIESNHTGTRQTGSVSPSLITFPAGSAGAATVVYTSSEVSGVDKIIVEADDGKVKKPIREELISVRVPGLVELGEGEGYDLMPQPDKGHPYNHFGKLDAFSVLWDITGAYFETEEGTLMINDISLPEGGAFDICGKWDPKLTCTTYPKGGHNTHRLGEDVDVDDETTEKNTVTEEALKKIMKDLDYVDNVKIKAEGNHFHLSILSIKAKKLPLPPPSDVIVQ